MCLSKLKPKVPKVAPIEVPRPPPPPPPPELTAGAPVVNEGSQRLGSRNRRNGRRTGQRSDLRIDINLAQPGGNGLNIPVG